MPRYKIVPSLYKICLKQVTANIYSNCKRLENNKNKPDLLKSINTFLCYYVPNSILDDILEEHSTTTINSAASESLISYYFYKVVLHNKVTKFKAKNHKLNLTYWQCLFQTSFHNLIVLNLALSSNDEILKLISIYCPNLEYLNATCRYERIMSLGTNYMNAAKFTLSVSDKGLQYLCNCKKLKVITINEPRSQKNSISYDGLRQLLMNIPTITDITYSDLGKVISQNMENIESLNLRSIRHFNATINSIIEILRLCKNVEEIYLTFFENDIRLSILAELIKSNLKLTTIGFVNLEFYDKFNEFFMKFGLNLVFLSISNSNETITFNNLITLGNYCPNLKYLKYNTLNNENEIINKLLINNQQFTKLEQLYINGFQLDLENSLFLLTENAKNLHTIKLTEYFKTRNIDIIFVNILTTLKLQHIEISSKLTFTKNGIRNIIEKYNYLNYLNVFCTEDCKDISNEINENNYDLVFINKTIESLWENVNNP